MRRQHKMRCIQLKVLKNQQVLAEQCYVAESFLDRFLGLMGTSHLEQAVGVLFPNCWSVHTWFMRFSIDVVFLKSDVDSDRFVVTSVHSQVSPWRPLPLLDSTASQTLELPEGTVERVHLQPGDIVCFG